MNFDEDLSAIHGYLCADGYVIRNPETQPHKYYHIGLRNLENILLKDFQLRFYRHFRLKPIITKEGRVRIQNKKIYFELTKKDTYYSGDWVLPKLSKKQLKFWLRAYFDCDGWVSVVKRKDRKIGLDSINEKGLIQIQKALQNIFKIDSGVHKRNTRHIWSLSICGKDDISKFLKEIGFLHPRKRLKLKEAIDSYMNYQWKIPKIKSKFIKFIEGKQNISKKRGKVRFYSIIKGNLADLKERLGELNVKSRISKRLTNGNGNSYYCLSVRLNEYNRIGF